MKTYSTFSTLMIGEKTNIGRRKSQHFEQIEPFEQIQLHKLHKPPKPLQPLKPLTFSQP